MTPEPGRVASPPQVARGLRFGTKLLLLLLGMILSVQFSGMVAVRVAVDNAVDAQLHRELEVGQRVWDEAQLTRMRQLFDRVSVLADDFGFKEAIASGDQPTIASALGNAGNRIGAAWSVVLSPQGELMAALLPGQARLGEETLRAVLAEAEREGFATGLGVLGEQPVSFVVVPVFAPDLVAWVGMGMPFGPDEIAGFSAVTGLQAAVVYGRACARGSASGELEQWQVPALLCERLRESGQAEELLFESGEGDEPMQVLRLSHGEFAPVLLAFKASRQRALEPYAGLRQQILLLTALATIMAVLAAVLIGRWVSRPLQRAGDAAARILQGDYSQPLSVRGHDELAELADAFNRMQVGIAEREQQIVFQAAHDALTGLPNRERALLTLNTLLKRSGEAEARGAVVLIDIRRFKQINDLLGHGFGDQVLLEAAGRLKSAVRGVDLVARLGGNEFLVLLVGVEPDTARQRAERIVQALQTPLELGNTRIQLEVGIGLALFPDNEISGPALMRRADIALNEAKSSEQTLVCYTPGHDEQHLRQLRLIGDLRDVIDSGQLSLVYQPKVDIASGRVTHGEALLRWTHPELGRIPPDEFIPLAERASLIRAISAWVVDSAIRQVRLWHEQGIECGVAINLSALDLIDVGLAESVLQSLKRHQVAPMQVILEVTESAVMKDLNIALDTLHRLKRVGIRISIDDFGTGQSSLAQLKRLPVDELKIDKSFVMSLLPGTDDEQIVHSIVELAHALSLKVVAEGVESETGLALLAKHGCETAQGYYFSRPLDADQYLRWYQQRDRDRSASA